MPEGPEIRRAADQVSGALKGRKIRAISLNLPAIKSYEEQLLGLKVTRIDTHGKAMLSRFENGLTLYSHNQLYGRWVITKRGELPKTQRQLRVAIHNQKMSAFLYSASEIEILDTSAIEHHRFLSRLGPDVLSSKTTAKIVLRRLTARPFYRRQLGHSLTNQSLVAGLGNYLRCEILFICGLHPSTRPCDCDDHQLNALAKTILSVTKQSYETGGITNQLSRAKDMINRGASFEEARFYLFRRDQQNCYQCDASIKKVYAGNQACYICPQCQLPVK